VDKFVIRKGLPIPARREATGLMEAMRGLEVGDSIELPYNFSRNTCWSYAARNGIKITVRVVREGGGKILRMWRIE
jgi:hypothetical protein